MPVNDSAEATTAFWRTLDDELPVVETQPPYRFAYPVRLPDVRWFRFGGGVPKLEYGRLQRDGSSGSDSSGSRGLRDTPSRIGAAAKSVRNVAKRSTMISSKTRPVSTVATAGSP